MSSLLIIIFIAIISGFIFGLLYEELKLEAQIIYQSIVVTLVHAVEYQKHLNIISSLYKTDTESIKEYQEGCNVDKLIEENNEDWKEEIRDYLSCYTPLIFTEFLIRRFEEIKNAS